MNKSPYEHIIIDNFLSETEFDAVLDVYKNEKFKELSTDLFSFLQSNEIEDKLTNFVKKVEKIVNSEQKYFYTCFASFYRKNDFLLCHDDCVDSREYAFTFYLDDFSSGELVLYENDCLTESKVIEVKKNRIVIFKVSRESFHEVKKCKNDGRKALTGWLNVEGKGFEEREIERNLSRSFSELDLKLDLSNFNGKIKYFFNRRAC